MCGATVQSMNHVRAMAETKLNEETNRLEITGVTETRVTGFVIHAMLASSIMLLPLIKKIPIPVVSGVFLFLGRRRPFSTGGRAGLFHHGALLIILLEYKPTTLPL